MTVVCRILYNIYMIDKIRKENIMNEGTKKVIIVSAASVVVTVIVAVAAVCNKLFDLIAGDAEF